MTRKLPRFSYQVPADLTEQFLRQMKLERRETPSHLLTAILREFFERHGTGNREVK